VLAPAGGQQLGAADYVAARSVDFAPHPDAMAKAARAFAERGFTVGPLVGNSFSIAAPPALFQEVFGAVPEVTTTSGGLELPLEQLDKQLRQGVQAVVVPQAPEWMK
jgi:hypothetical protein